MVMVWWMLTSMSQSLTLNSHMSMAVHARAARRVKITQCFFPPERSTSAHARALSV
jgi:hypothetical protein